MPEPLRSRPWPRPLAWIAWALLAASLAYLALALGRAGREAAAIAWRVRPGLLALSLVCLAADLLLVPELWRQTLRECGTELPRRRALTLWVTTGLGRYLPGKVWPLLGQVYWGRALALDAATVWRSNVRLALYAAGAQLVAAAVLLFEPPAAGRLPFQIARLVAAAAGIALLHGAAWEWLDRRLGLGWSDRSGPSRRGPIALLLACQWGLFVLAVGLALAGCWPGGAPPSAAAVARATLLVAGSFGAAQAVAMAAVVVPGGLGVREGALAALLGLWLGPAAALGYGIASRLWLVAGEALTLLVAAGAALLPGRAVEPRGDAVWEARARLGGLRAVLDPADWLGGRNRLIHELHARALRPLLEVPAGAVVLDVGSGNGRVLSLWAEAGATAFGVDRSLALLRTSRCGRPCVCADIRALPFRDGTFSALSCVYVLVHVDAMRQVENAAGVARELRRVAVAGGRLLAIEKLRRDVEGPLRKEAWAGAGWRVELTRAVREGSSWRSRLALLVGAIGPVRAALVRGEERTAGRGHGAYRDVLTVLRAGSDRK